MQINVTNNIKWANTEHKLSNIRTLKVTVLDSIEMILNVSPVLLNFQPLKRNSTFRNLRLPSWQVQNKADIVMQGKKGE
jgi:hypothetical protein